MKLNILGKSLLAVGMLSMVACSDDIIDGTEQNGTDGNGDGYYMAINIQLPSDNGTRSSTSDEGNGQSDATPPNENGFSYENSVDNVLIVLASNDNSFITAGSVASSKLNPVASQNTMIYRPIAKLEKTNISEFYNKAGNNRLINVFVFCNPTSDLIDAVKKANLGDQNWYNLTCEVLEGNNQSEKNTGIWSADGFLMSNRLICTRELPANIDEWKKYNTEASAFDLSGINSSGQDGEVDNSAAKGRGSVLVERNVARFDFRDGSKLGDNTYNVIYTLDQNNQQVPLFNVQLNRILLTNEAKEFYYLPRVSDTGLLSNYTLCGSETKTNYMVGPFASTFSDGIPKGTYANYFNYPFFNTSAETDYRLWSGKLINSVLSGTEDNLTDEEMSDQYHVWRYVTENVIPAPNDNQTMGRTTMVVFKGRLLADAAAFNSDDQYTKDMAETIGDGTADHPTTLSGVSTKDPVIYYYNNTPYFGWENIKKAAIESALQFNSDGVPTTDESGHLTGIRRSSSLYLAVFGDGCMGQFTWGSKTYNDSPEDMKIDPKSTNALYDAYETDNSDDNRAKFKAAVVRELITIYESSRDEQDGPGYYFYYYYKNRHNDNLDNGTMGVMEFAVVRNNVYKLAVTNINTLGHPRIPENDPDAPNPDTPDESDDLYITVNCRVLPWVVRVNNIEF